MSELILNLKPSMVVGYDGNGKIHVVLIGDAEETLKRFKEERDKTNFKKVCWIRKMRFDKQKWTDRPDKQTVSIDNSQYDGDAGAALKEAEEAAEEAAAAAVIGDKEQSPAPRKRGKAK